MTKRYTILILLFSLLATGFAGSTYAQTNDSDTYVTSKEQRQRERAERKKLKKENKERLRRLDEPVVKKATVTKKKYIVEYPQTTIKNRYRIDVLVQMYLDDLVKGGNVTYKDRIPDKAKPGMAFYQGINMAADSLKKAGFKIDIYIHDIASAAEASGLLVSKGILDSADLIIGAVPVTDIPVLADLAGSKNINFVSTLSAVDGNVKSNAYFTMLQPSLKAHCEWIANTVVNRSAGKNILLLYRKTVESDSLAWKDVVNTDTFHKAEIQKVSCKTLPSLEKLAAHIDTGKTNIVVMPILDNVYADSILKLLATNFPATHFEVYGMPTWNVMSAAKKKALPNISVYLTVSFRCNPASPTAKYIARTFKKDYGGKPSEMVYRGYETMFWYANLLKRYGTVFNEHYADNASAPFTNFEVKPQWDKDGDILYNENVHVMPSDIQAY
jgi:Periplasmic binding protein